MVRSAVLGYPRIGEKRELKKAVESYWAGKSSAEELLTVAAHLRKKHWQVQKDAGIDIIPSNDFSLYDHVLDMTATVGAVPARYTHGGNMNLETYFAMARGVQDGSNDVSAMEMTKWFDTNYHYIVPEFEPKQQFRFLSRKVVDEFAEALSMGITTRPVLIGPVTFLKLGKGRGAELNTLELLPALLPVYEELFAALAEAGAEWVQVDEPFLALDLSPADCEGYRTAYSHFAQTKNVKYMLTTYFEGLRNNLDLAVSLPVDGIHIDLVRCPNQLDTVLQALSKEQEKKRLSLGVVDGRNVWITNMEHAVQSIQSAEKVLGDVIAATSCSLLHTPVDIDNETQLPHELRSWMAFAKQKLHELAALARNDSNVLRKNAEAVQARANSPLLHKQEVKQRLADVTESMYQRSSPYAQRRRAQDTWLKLPPLPTTTIGSYPQTVDVRKKRAAYKRGELNTQDYETFLKAEIERTIRFQEEVGLDVLVHGEFERTDMVEYFGEQLDGIAISVNGWVQSYGTRCVRPPFIYGDVSRPAPMTVRWSEYAQSLSKKVMKGMLTGPVTILQWSFVRDDQPREMTCKQIALAMRDEVQDLEASGIQIIQVDEAAFREGLPLRRNDWNHYLRWAVDSFRLTTSGIKDETQLHTHMCYSEFNDIISSIANMDADVISIENSRSDLELLHVFLHYQYPNEIGPGVYDIHSPRVPSKEEMLERIQKNIRVLRLEQTWVNPDCGLKTRKWEEVRPALIHMVAAAKEARKTLSV